MTSVEVLEELGEETDGVVESASKMQEKLKALTGVDIVNSSGAYKDTYTILKEIGSVWAELSDMDKAGALELMAGKNRANTLSAILGNMADIEGAYISAMHAEGSALKENEAYLDSIQGRIDLFTNSLQTMWMNFINDDVIKFVVDVGRGLVTLIDNLGAIETIIIGYMGYLTFIKKTDWKKISDSIRGIFSKDTAFKPLEGNDITAEISVLNRYTEKGGKELQDYINCTRSAQNGIQAYAQQLNGAKGSVDGYTAAMKNMTAEQKKAAAESAKIAKQQQLHNIAVFALTTAFTVGIDIIKHFTQDNESLSESYDKLQSSISSLTSELDSLYSELGSVQDRISELSGKKLSLTEAEELQALKEQSDELQRQIGLKETLLEGREQQNQVTTLAKINDMLKTTAAGQADAVETAKTVGGWVGKLLDVVLIAGGVAVTGLTGGLATAGGAAMIAAGSSGLGSAAAEGIGGLIANEAYDTKNGTLLEWYESYRDAIKKAQQEASAAESKYFQTLNDDDYEKWQTKVNKLSGLQTELFDGLEELQGYMSNLEYNDTTASIIDAYNQMMAQIEIENVGDGVQDRIEAVKSLQSEYEELLKGLDENGNNVALSSQEYSRYQSIVQQLVAYSPKLIQGYDAEGNAILNRNSLIEDGIELLRQQQREEAKTKMSKLWDTYQTEQSNIDEQIKQAKQFAKDKKKNIYIGNSLDRVRDISEIIGVDYTRYTDLGDYIVDNAMAVRANMDAILDAAGSDLKNAAVNAYSEYLTQILSQVDTIDTSMSQFKASLYDIPLASNYYHNLEGSHVSFIDNYINSLGDLSNLTNQEVLQIKNNILQLTDTLGQQNTLQELVNEFMAINPNIPASIYSQTIDQAFDKLVDSEFIPDNVKQILKEQKDALIAELFPNEAHIANNMQFVKQKLNDEYDKLVDGLTVTELKIAYRFVKDKEDGSLDWTDIEAAFVGSKDIAPIDPYSTLSESVTNYQEKLQQALEITTDGTLITQEFKEELIALGISEEKLAECFAENNDLLIENADVFSEVVKAGKEVIAGNIRVAKSRAQLKYNDLVKELDMVTEGYEGFTEETQAAANALIDQISTIKDSINQYQQLEDTLLGTANAFDKFAKAQEADSKNTYGESYVSMAQTMYDAIYKTGQVGSAQFWAAVKATVPDDIYMHLLPGEKQINAIAKYLNSNVFPTLTLSEDSFSIDYSDIESFVEKAQDVGLFTGADAKSFGLSVDFINSLGEGENALKAFADRMGMTTTQVYAMFAEMDKYNADGFGLSMLQQLDNSVAGQITNVNNGLEQLRVQRKALIEQRNAAQEVSNYKDVARIQTELNINQDNIADYEAQLSDLHNQATATVKEFAQIDNIMLRIGDIDNISVGELKEIVPDSIETQLNFAIGESVEEMYQKLIDYRMTLEEPTVMELDIARDAIDEELNALIEQYGETELELGVKYDVSGTGLREVNYENLGSLDAATLERYVELKNANLFIDSALEDGLTKSETFLKRIADNTDIMAGKNEQKARTGGGGQAEKGAGTGGSFRTGSQSDPVINPALIPGTPEFEKAKNNINKPEYPYYSETGGGGAGKHGPAYDPYNPTIDDASITINGEGQIMGDMNAAEDFFNGTGGKGSIRVIEDESSNGSSGSASDINQGDGVNKAAQETLAGTELLLKTYDLVEKRLKELGPTTMISADELNDLGLGYITNEALTAADALLLAQQRKSQLMVPGTSGGLFDATEIKEGVYTYSELQTKVVSFNELIDQSDEIIADNAEVTHAYKDSLTELFKDNEEQLEEVNKCFDDNNDLVVTNSQKLKRLVKEKKKELSTDVKLSKSQAKLKYYELYKEMKKLTGGLKYTSEGYATLTDKQREQLNTLHQEMTAMKSAIAQFSLLEMQLLGTTNAYTKFQEAQGIDSENDYGTQAEEMVSTLATAFNTGELGTESARAAFLGLIPEEVYANIDTFDKKMQAIYKYFTDGELSKYFTIEFDDDGNISSVETTLKDAKKFVSEGVKNGVFTGNWEHFDLTEDVTSLEQLAQKMGVTEEVAYAMLSTLERYDAGNLFDPSSILEKFTEGDLEYQAYRNVQALADLEWQLANGMISADEYNKTLYGLDGQLARGTISQDDYNKSVAALKKQLEEGTITQQEYNEAVKGVATQHSEIAQQAYNEVTAYNEKTKALAEANEKLEEYYKLLNSDNKTDDTSTPIDKDKVLADIEAVETEIDQLTNDLQELEEPAEMTITFAMEHIDAQLTVIEQNIGRAIKEGSDYTIDLKTGEYTVVLDKNDPNYQEVVDYVALLEEKRTLELQMGGGAASVTDILGDIAGTLERIAQILDPTYTLRFNTSGTDKISAAKSLIESVKSKTVTLTQKVVTTGQSIIKKVAGFFSGDYINGTAHVNGSAYKGGSWGAPQTETALVGELGPEMVVRGDKWTLVGEHGAGFTDIRKGDIVFNHKQTKDLLSNGHITGRGKAFAEGTAYGDGIYTWTDKVGDVHKDYGNNASSSLNDAADKMSDAADEFREVFDWIEVRIEEINEDISLKSAKLENTVGSKNQNAVIDDMIKLNQKLYDNLTAGAAKYYDYSEKLLAKVPAEYRKAAQNGAIAIEEFVGKTDEETLNAIQEYREWVQKGADATQQAEETLTEISTLAKQAIDNIAADYENKTSLRDIKVEQLEAYNALLETDVGYESEKIYQAMMKETNKNIKTITEQRDKMQAELDKRVESGQIKKYSQDWYDAVNDIAAVDTQIIELKTDIEDWQDAINELHWDKLDDLMGRLEAVSNEAENLIDILGTKDVVDEMGEWTKEGVTSLGLYAQQMEVAEMQAKKYKDEISYLNKNWKKLGYTEQEYVEKLEELKSAQYDSIQAYHAAKDAIVDLNKERVDAIKEGIEKEIDAYTELIEKQKELLDSEKDLYDFQKNIQKQEKEIADIQRQLSALAGDNSASARAQRARLEAELAEANAALEETYYDRSISKQQEALDKELENFHEAKDKEIEGWEEYLENTELVVSDSLSMIQANTDTVYKTLQELGKEYGLSITETLTSPWKEGEYAIQDYTEKFKLSMSATVEELKELMTEFNDIVVQLEKDGATAVKTVDKNVKEYTQAKYQKPQENENSGGNAGNGGDSGSGNGNNGGGSGSGSGSSAAGLVSSISEYIKYGNRGSNVKKLQKALNALGFNCGKVDGIFGDKTLAAVKSFQKSSKYGGAISVDGIVGPNTKKKFKVAGYASGTTEVKRDQLAILDELGEELQLVPDGNGRLAYIQKGTSIIPHDISENLMKLGQLDPSTFLDQNRPSIGVHPEIHNTEINIDMNIAEVVHVDRVDNSTLPDLTKAIEKQMNSYMSKVNSSLKRYTR